MRATSPHRRILVIRVPERLLSNNLIGTDVEHWIDDKIASGAAKVMGRADASNRMGEAG